MMILSMVLVFLQNYDNNKHHDTDGTHQHRGDRKYP